jgi:hypothetical protein
MGRIMGTNEAPGQAEKEQAGGQGKFEVANEIHAPDFVNHCTSS